MQKVYQFFRLIRFSNILVMVLTMTLFYGLLSNFHRHRQYILSDVNEPFELVEYNFIERLGLLDFNFILLILSVILVASSGNIINDYFDQKADRVNKPNRIIIDKYIKRRWAIILNWTFNGIGFLIALFLSYTLDNWWISLISFLSINLLYFYSAIYKRKFLVGNLIVAFLTALVPLYVFVYAAFSNFPDHSPFGSNATIFLEHNLKALTIYAGYAFLFNIIREIIKDIADVKGDLLLKSQTLPIRFGLKKTKTVLLLLYIVGITPLLYFIYSHTSMSDEIFLWVRLRVFIYLLIAVVVLTLISMILLILHNKRKYYLASSNFLKFAMLFGVISALFYT